MARPLTHKRVLAIRPTASRQEIPDPAYPGLYLVVQPSGTKSWALRYRFGGRTRKLTLGRLNALSLADARKAASDALAAIDRGRDPSVDKVLENCAKRAGENTVRSLIDEFEQRHLSTLRTGRSVRQSLDHNVTPILGDMDVKDITRQDIVRLLERIADAGKGTTANRTKAYLSKFLGWCQDRGVIQQSPMLGLKPIAIESSRSRPLTANEIRAFWVATEAEPAPYGPLFRMLLLTGQRRGEVTSMRWTDIDANGVWRLSNTKNNRRHDVPLPKVAQNVLAGLLRLGEYVFSTTGDTPSTSLSKPQRRIAARMVEITGHDIAPWVPHDIRHTVKTGLANLKVPLDIRSRLTNHISDIPVMDRRYNHASYHDEKRAALEKWARFVTDLVDDEPDDKALHILADQP